MAEIIKCPACQSQLQLPDGLRGQNVKCPKCSSQFATTSSAPAPAPFAFADEPADTGRSRRRPRRRRYDDDEDDDDEYDDDREFRRRRRRRDYLPHRGTAILVMGILSLVGLLIFACLSIILGPIAWIMGNNDLREIRAGRMDPEGEGSTNAGRICGMIATILCLVAICIVGAIVFISILQGRGGRFR